jgi:hypothetical protein
MVKSNQLYQSIGGGSTVKVESMTERAAIPASIALPEKQNPG